MLRDTVYHAYATNCVRTLDDTIGMGVSQRVRNAKAEALINILRGNYLREELAEEGYFQENPLHLLSRSSSPQEFELAWKNEQEQHFALCRSRRIGQAPAVALWQVLNIVYSLSTGFRRSGEPEICHTLAVRNMAAHWFAGDFLGRVMLLATFHDHKEALSVPGASRLLLREFNPHIDWLHYSPARLRQDFAAIRKPYSTSTLNPRVVETLSDSLSRAFLSLSPSEIHQVITATVYYLRMRNFSPESVVTKLADVAHNAATIDGFSSQEKRELQIFEAERIYLPCLQASIKRFSQDEETHKFAPGTNSMHRCVRNIVNLAATEHQIDLRQIIAERTPRRDMLLLALAYRCAVLLSSEDQVTRSFIDETRSTNWVPRGFNPTISVPGRAGRDPRLDQVLTAIAA